MEASNHTGVRPTIWPTSARRRWRPGSCRSRRGHGVRSREGEAVAENTDAEVTGATGSRPGTPGHPAAVKAATKDLAGFDFEEGALPVVDEGPQHQARARSSRTDPVEDEVRGGGDHHGDVDGPDRDVAEGDDRGRHVRRHRLLVGAEPDLQGRGDGEAGPRVDTSASWVRLSGRWTKARTATSSDDAEVTPASSTRATTTSTGRSWVTPSVYARTAPALTSAPGRS